MKKITKAIIPAAGLGTRFLPATIAQPKEMLPIVDKPVIQYVVEETVAAGIKDILIVTGRNKRAIEDHFDPSFELESALTTGQRHNLVESINEVSSLANICYVRQRRPKGLADAVSCAKSFVGVEPFAVLLGDVILDGAGRDLKKMVEKFEQTGKSVVALEHVNKDNISKYGVASVEEGENGLKVKDLIEKPKAEDAPSDLAIASRYIFDSGIFDAIDKTEPGRNGEIQLTDAMRQISAKQNLLGHIISEKRHDIGSKIGFIKANIEFALKREDTKAEISDFIQNLEI